MIFDLHAEIAALFSRQHELLTAENTTLDADQIVGEIHALVDTCSEQDLHGFADALALYAELFQQMFPEGTAPQDPSLLSQMHQQFLSLSRAEAPALPVLLTLLQDSRWPEPVPEDDCSFLKDILQDDLQNLTVSAASAGADTTLDATVPPAESAPEASADTDTTPAPEQPSPAVDAQQPQPEKLVTSSGADADENTLASSLIEQAVRQFAACPDVTARIECCHQLVDLFSEGELAGFADTFALAAELFAQECSPQDSYLSAAINMLLRNPGEQPISSLLETMTDPDWQEPLPEDDATFLLDLLQEDAANLSSQVDLTESSVTAPVNEDIPEFCEVDFSLLEQDGPNVDPEVLTMLTMSLTDLHGRWQSDDSDYQTRLADSRELLMPINRAAQTLNLHGLHVALNGLDLNFSVLAKRETSPASDTTQQIVHCLATLIELLNNLENSDTQRDLIELFSSPALPCNLNHDQAAFVSGLLALASVQTTDDIVKETAGPAHISLDMHDDVDPNLQDMLFVELPALVEDFLQSIQNIVETGDLDNLVLAQRTAHTLKGLANMAGIQGLANLTHTLEDILDKLVEEQSAPGEALKEDLLEAADCLAAMGETITDNAPEPDNALEMLQRVMDWSYLLKTEGIEAATKDLATDDRTTEAGASATPAAEKPATSDEASAPQEDTAAPAKQDQAEQDTAAERREENYLRVPQSLLDNLFRITGENSTLTAQLDAELTQLRTLTRSNRERQRNMQRVIFELEQQLNEYYTLHPELDPDSDGFDPLEMDNYNEMHTSISRLHEAAADVREVEQEMDGHIRLLSDLHVAQSGLQKESMANVLSTRLVPVKSISSRVQRIMRQACRAAGKKANLIIEGEDVQVDSQILAQLTDPLMHIIRNAVDHGLESAGLRQDAGKPLSGKLTLRFEQANDEIRVTCEDDGAGIDGEKIRQVAIGKGLIDETTTLNQTELQRLILLPGFSTREEISQLSGRGIGMDVVYQEIMRLQGTLNIDSEVGRGTRFELAMPASSLMIRALLVRAGRQLIALSSHGVEQSVLSLDGTLTETSEGLQFSVGDELYPAVTLETLVAERKTEYGGDRIHPVLIVNLGQGEKVAVMVSEILAHRELVFKEMGEYVPDIPGIPGVTILSNGEAAPVVDLPARIQFQQSGKLQISEHFEQEAALDLPKVMVVDDSVSARKSLATFLKDTGYEVSTAIDGLDALNQIRKQPPDLVITDLEMPRMSGIELSAAIRQHKDTGEIPVVMVTSRSTDKHREEADNAGVTDYLTKPWTETGLLECVEQHLS